jgi:6-phosphogluconolactonase
MERAASGRSLRTKNSGAPGAACPVGRRLLIGLFIVLVVMAFAVAAPAREFFVYFGTFTTGTSKGIYVSRLDAATGKLSAPELAAETPSPCYLAVSPLGTNLYAANNLMELNGKKNGAVSAFAIDKSSGRLTLINQKSTGGPGTCYVSADLEAATLLAANYADGSVKSFQLDRSGAIGADGSYIRHHGTGVNTNRQTAPHPHFILPDPSNRFALVCDLGADQVVVYKINPTDGTLAAHSSAAVPPGSGARHLAFSPDGKFAHVINEMGCSITTFAWDARAGELTPVETISVLPPGVSADASFTAAEIVTVGNHVYATIRGHDSVSVFAADPRTGRLSFVQNIPSGGSFPRGLGIDPTGRWLMVGDQKANLAVEYAIDPNTGKIAPTGQALNIGSPVDVKFVEIP